jgi:orotate phosphoribosyltransferase
LLADEVIELFRESGALLEGHYVLSSGLHSSTYLQSALVLQHPTEAAILGRALSQHFKAHEVETVASPAIGGLIIGHEVARALGARFVWTERDDGGQMTLRRGFSVRPQERVLVIEDVLTTGGSTRETIAALSRDGASVVGAGSIIDRSGGLVDLEVTFAALAKLDVPAFEPSKCKACVQGVPLVKPGSRILIRDE